jgi:hypothetical protein
VTSAKKIMKLTLNKNVDSVLIPLNLNAKHSDQLISGSHMGECANKTKNNLNKMYNVMGLVKPGANIRNLYTSAKNLVETLTKSDVLVFSGGTKDVGKYNSEEGLIKKYAELCQN